MGKSGSARSIDKCSFSSGSLRYYNFGIDTEIYSAWTSGKASYCLYRIWFNFGSYYRVETFFFSGRDLYLGVMLGVQSRPLHVKVEFKSRSPLEIDDFTQMLRKDKIKRKKLPKSYHDIFSTGSILMLLRPFERSSADEFNGIWFFWILDLFTPNLGVQRQGDILTQMVNLVPT